jgi:hypothetical protein
MNEFGIDTAYANYVTQAMLQHLEYGIFRLTDLGYVGSGTSSYYNKSNTPDAACLPNMQLLQANGKPAGMYFFSHAWSAASATFEANYCCDQLDLWHFKPQLGVYMDFERFEATGRIGGYENLVYLLGRVPTGTEMQAIVTAWCETVTARGYKAGFYMNSDPIIATGNTWIQNARFASSLGSPYFWLSQVSSQNSYDCDIWQYQFGQPNAWYGITIDYNRVMHERVLRKSGIPIWLLLKMKGDEKRNGHTILL